jgi:hypothetical protein
MHVFHTVMVHVRSPAERELRGRDRVLALSPPVTADLSFRNLQFAFANWLRWFEPVFVDIDQ